jgi:putative NADH-flavin reductase
MRQNVLQKRIVVLGATGATGRAVVAEALHAGHEVTALVRRPGSLAPDGRLDEVVWEDVADAGAVIEVLRDAGPDVVISALGGAGKGPTTVCADAMRTTVPAMTGAGVRRLIVVSAHGVLETHDRSLYSRAVWAGVGERMQDKEAMEPLITGSTLDWTIVRPPALKDTPPTSRYVVGEDLPIRLWHAIGRADLAAFLVREAGRDEFVRRYPRIHR